MTKKFEKLSEHLNYPAVNVQPHCSLNRDLLKIGAPSMQEILSSRFPKVIPQKLNGNRHAKDYLLYNKQRSLDCALFCYKARTKRLEHEKLLYLFYNKKNPLHSPSITFNFQNKRFQSEQQCHQRALYTHKARCNKPIRIPVRMVQII